MLQSEMDFETNLGKGLVRPKKVQVLVVAT
jgi:hypothetical protein